MRVYNWYFDLPLYTLVPFITSRLMLETDFVNEADNATKMAELVANEPRLAGRVYIPKIYRELSSPRVLTTEWIEGVRLWDREGITAPWRGGRGRGSPGAGGAPLPPPTQSQKHSITAPYSTYNTQLKPDRTSYKGPRQSGGLGLSLEEVMNTMVSLFSAQMFQFGLLHCDPHPGNIFIRRLPSGRSELVLIDHGLYITMSPEFRHQYTVFWKSMLSFDTKTMKEVTSKWGVRAPDLFASATLMRPYDGGDGSTKARITNELKGKTPSERHYEVQNRLREGIRDILTDQEAFPQELVFIGRNMRIVQGNNQFLGSPVNRIKLMGLWASRSLVEDRRLGWAQRWKWAWRHMLFRVTLLGTDVAWWVSRFKQSLGLGEGMEDELEKQMAFIAKDQLGVDLQHSIFDG